MFFFFLIVCDAAVEELLTRKVGQRSLAADEAGRGHGGHGLSGGGAEAGADSGRRAEERRSHCYCA